MEKRKIDKKLPNWYQRNKMIIIGLAMFALIVILVFALIVTLAPLLGLTQGNMKFDGNKALNR